ncbi:hypothetical protein ABFV05_020733 [Capra hircus]
MLAERRGRIFELLWLLGVRDAGNPGSITALGRSPPTVVPFAWQSSKSYSFILHPTVSLFLLIMCFFFSSHHSHVLLCNVTQRVSFWFVVTDPSRNHTLPAVEVQSAIRMNRNRINNAFFLNDQTLEFLRIPSTLAPPTDPSVPIWIIIFGVIFCIVLVATMLLILSGFQQHRRVLSSTLMLLNLPF